MCEAGGSSQNLITVSPGYNPYLSSVQYTSMLNAEEANSGFSFQDKEHYSAKSCARSLCISKRSVQYLQ